MMELMPGFCKEYEIFKDTPDGVFVDKLSGHLYLIPETDLILEQAGCHSPVRSRDQSTEGQIIATV